MSDNSQRLLEAIMKYCRPATFPVAVKLVKEKTERPDRAKRPMEALGHPIALCQGVALARRYGWTVVFEKADHGCPVGIIMLGYEPPEELHKGVIAYPGYAGSLAAAAKMEQANFKLPPGTIQEIWLAPLEKASFSPDIVIVYGNAAQIARLIQATNYKSGEGVDSKAFGRQACASYIARTYLEDKCSLIVPSGGERVFAICQDDELVFAIPASQFDDITDGLESVHRQGLVRYPTPFYGLMVEPKFPNYYWSILPEGIRK